MLRNCFWHSVNEIKQQEKELYQKHKEPSLDVVLCQNDRLLDEKEVEELVY